MIVVRMLLNSWATLEARAPTLERRWAWRSCWRRTSVSSDGAASVSGPGMGSSPGRGSSLAGYVTDSGIGPAVEPSSSELHAPAAAEVVGGAGNPSRAGSFAGGPHFLRFMGARHLVRDVTDPPGPPNPPGPDHLAERGVRDPPEPRPVGGTIPLEHADQGDADDDPVRDDGDRLSLVFQGYPVPHCEHAVADLVERF